MNFQHFGDSYDIVKQSLIRWLGPLGPWSAHPMFTETEEHKVTSAKVEAFARFLGVPLVSTDVFTSNTVREPYLDCGRAGSVFLDPDTGVRMDNAPTKGSPKYIYADELVRIASARPDGLVLVFDQSLDRNKDTRDQIRGKLKDLETAGLRGFAYVSHATFLILGKSNRVAQADAYLRQESRLPDNVIVEAGR